MGKFVEEKALIETHLQNYVTQAYDFSKFIEGGPTFVTYYSKDILASTEDITLGDVLEVVGVESPIKFNRIENFPLYGLDPIAPTIDIDEIDGVSTSIEGDAIILPNTVKPLPNDYFSVKGQAGTKLFKINNVEVDNAGTKVMYKITYYLSNDSHILLEENQLSENYKVVYENIGKDINSVIKESDFLLLDNIDSAYELIWKNYLDYYYNEDYNAFLFDDRVYDNFLAQFISNSNLFIKTRSFLKNIMVEPLLKSKKNDYTKYDGTIFSAIERKDSSILLPFKYYNVPVTDRSSIFNLYKNKYNITHLDYDLRDYPTFVPIFDDTFIINIQNNNLYDITFNKDNRIKNFLIQYINKSLDKEELVQYIEETNFSLSIENYLLLPCFLFILKETKNVIINK